MKSQDVWDSPMWRGLMAWAEEDPLVARWRIFIETSRRRITALLAEDALDSLTIEAFNRDVWQLGHVITPDGTRQVYGDWSQWSLQEIEQKLEGEWRTTGNLKVKSSTGIWGPMLTESEEERTALLRSTLKDLLYGPEPAYERIRAADKRRNGFSDNSISLMLAMIDPTRFGIVNDYSRTCLTRLSVLLRVHDEWEERIAGQYEALNELLLEIHKHSLGALPDLISLDLFLLRVGPIPEEPHYWKVALGLRSPDHKELVRAAGEGGFAAIGFSDAEDDRSVIALRKVMPGDYVVMHTEGKIGGVGQVTRPYYEVSRDDEDGLDARWYRRIGVDWLLGEREYGDALPGAKQRLTVADLDEDAFWSLAAKYADDPRYEEVLGRMPPAADQANAWIFQCNPERWDLLAALRKPVPFRENWAANQNADEMRIGDTVYLWKAGVDAGIYGVAHIISDLYNTPGDEFGERKVDLIVEWPLTEEPLLKEALSQDSRTAAMRVVTNPQGTNFRLSAEEEDAVREMLGMPEECYFSLVSNDAEEEQARGEAYHYWHKAGGKPRELTAAVTSGRTARYLLYHSSPRFEIDSFGGLRGLEPPTGPPENDNARVELQNVRFPDPLRLKDEAAEAWMARTDFLRDGLKFFNKMQTIHPLSARDYYTVVGAGLGAHIGPTPGGGNDDDEETNGPLLQIATECCCSIEFVCDIRTQLERKKQVIFFGPPGTGKTFVGRKIAEYLAEGDDSRRELIQFHPSYTYEDFMEGIKPESRQCGEDRWEVSYPVRAGSFKRFCERAAEDAEHTYVFVIDEINRGQIAKIFGELMYLLEYRDDKIELAYTKSEGDDRERFGIPPNVLIIGTMNTADRSIALVDFALRRRFTFIPFYPDEGDVRGMLPMWLDGHASHMDWVGRMLDIVNKRLTEAMGRDYLIGHSYFMCDGLNEGLVREVWRYQIEPLLHEYFVGTPERVRTEFGLEALIRQAKGLPDDEPDEEAASE